MLNLVSPARAALPIWMVHLQVEPASGGWTTLDDDDVEPVIELLYRTDGVRSVAVVPLAGGLAVALGLDAADVTAALQRARGLAVSCARYACLGEVAVRRAHVTPAPDAGTA